MSLTYYYKFKAPAETPAYRLEEFLRSVEAKTVGFQQTLVLNATFESPERQAFARRLVSGFHVEDDRLKTAVLPLNPSVWNYSQSEGSARLIPTRGVILVVADERGCETCFGFFKYPEFIKDQGGHIVVESGLGGKWIFEDWVKTPDPRFRAIVKEFSTAGYVIEEQDDFRQV
jgi:hypothetical protein